MNLDALQDLHGRAAGASGSWHRVVEKGFAAEMDEIGHSVLYSGRYHRKGEFPVLYLAISPECAYREKVRQVHGRAEDLRPLVAGTFTVRIARRLDLTDAEVRRELAVERDALIAPADHTVAQYVAREARRLGFEAILAPSAVGEDCRNLVVFKDKLVPPSCCLLDPRSVRPYP